ncbi:ImmA/IrrE family metallo-endopeptidase [Listeria welshimeri]|uniref:ImmA/IrrE family metallo-endopeptidase n=1 Tax=Listeria TaxID=1637 RepID=UPI00068FDA49|nr:MULTISPECIES: ImmA/IrrE family metallo-endopeptidase [Listeria]EAD1842015.1 ImmA/IrrE family metallo-endopeptidase [Listeria monocytogenes]EAD7934042.1 ImmA/IrrE family metallo-endopeptidase [Listeria monocytogenes]EAD8411532.1 ImmA/IrrE family metallo-endopeptidase [Listeria monocytogenes]EAE1772499.1 ImmA/IrrE family metallo-endopeptidase [Listeria monocytogenes]EAE3174212.1 ImmA/IrrE family metallo-endopeptidase [Listeria monocytogenes]
MEKIKVGGIWYEIKEVTAVDIAGDKNYLGACDYDNQTIEILESLPETRKRQVLIHELTHAILYEAGYQEHDEELVERFSIVAYQVIEDLGKGEERIWQKGNMQTG